jgi:hypothetical protein
LHLFFCCVVLFLFSVHLPQCLIWCCTFKNKIQHQFKH